MALTQERLKELLKYEPDTGEFLWLESRGRARAGGLAGGVCPDGYVRIRVDGLLYLAHRLAWFYVHGTFPREMLDHRNRVKSDNRIANIRECSKSENAFNSAAHEQSSSVFKGVSLAMDGRWSARICVNGKTTFLGDFARPELAAAAYDSAAAKMHGEFARLNEAA